MKLVFLSNYYSHHQKATSEAWYQQTKGGYVFVSTEEMTQERRQMGWGQDVIPPFVIACGTPQARQLPERIDTADCVILGNAPMALVEKRLKQGRLVLKYSERVFKRGYQYSRWLPRLFTYWRNYGRHKSFYLLAASAYASGDFAMHGAFRKKSYKWGYFTETMHYDAQQLLAQKQVGRILWCGRLIHWKHPEIVLEVARWLRAQGYAFQLDMIGVGELEAQLQKDIEKMDLADCVHMLGSMTPQQVRKHMEQAQIYLFTSDFQEGWGAVLNEAMNSGCAVVASHAVGSAPFLLRHGENGLIYKNGDQEDLYRKVKALLDHPEQQKQLGLSAYKTITELWNGEVAAQRLLTLAQALKVHGRCDLYADGPCSRAKPLKNNWFREEDYDVLWIAD